MLLGIYKGVSSTALVNSNDTIIASKILWQYRYDNIMIYELLLIHFLDILWTV